MDHISLLVIVVIITALAFDFTNGFHDTANAMATSIATGALRPKVAVLISAVLNLVGAFLSTKVAATISSGIVNDQLATPAIIFAGLVGAILWNLVTWLFGLPSSSSHALFGGLIGAMWVGAGVNGIHFDQVISKVLLPAIASPLVAGIAAMIATYLAYRITHRSRQDRITSGFRHGQTISASLVSLAHGTNDAQKTMGIIAGVLYTSGYLAKFTIPFWVVLICHAAIALGTMAGGWRIVKTMGQKITKLRPVGGFCAETAGAVTLLGTAMAGIPVSTTHTITGAIMGVGATRRLSSVRWGVANRIIWAWVLTIPLSALISALSYYFLELLV